MPPKTTVVKKSEATKPITGKSSVGLKRSTLKSTSTATNEEKASRTQKVASPTKRNLAKEWAAKEDSKPIRKRLELTIEQNDSIDDEK